MCSKIEGGQHVAPDDAEVGGRIVRCRLLDDPAQAHGVPGAGGGVDDPVTRDLLPRDRAYGDYAAAPAGLVRPQQLGRARLRPEDEVVGEEQREGLASEVWLRPPDRVRRAQGLALLDEGGEAREALGGTRTLHESVVAPLAGDALQPRATPEVLAHGGTLGGSHDHDVLDARRGCLLDGVLDDGPVDDRQHLLGDGFGRGQHARA